MGHRMHVLSSVYVIGSVVFLHEVGFGQDGRHPA